MLTGTEIFGGTVTIMAGITMILKQLGFIHFGRKNGCPDSSCHEKVVQTITKVELLERGQTKIFEKLDGMPQRIVTLLKDAKGLLD